jgi:lipoate-protein ligase B
LIPLRVSYISSTDYASVWTLQQRLWKLRFSNVIEDTLLLTEHKHVYTFGKSADDNHLLATEDDLRSEGIGLFQVDRGGDVTYHGPGQIVGYPIIDLKHYYRDIHRYLRDLEEVIIRTLSKFNFSAVRESDMTGVWVEGEKIAAIGIKVSRWITMHGFALNVNTDLEKFGRIIPCGIFHKGVTSMEKISGKKFSLESVRAELVNSFVAVFGCSPEWITARDLEPVKEIQKERDMISNER